MPKKQASMPEPKGEGQEDEASEDETEAETGTANAMLGLMYSGNIAAACAAVNAEAPPQVVLTEEEQRQRVLERNRANAQKNRDRQKIFIEVLEKEKERLIEANQSLREQNAVLRQTIATFRDYLLANAHRVRSHTDLQGVSQAVPTLSSIFPALQPPLIQQAAPPPAVHNPQISMSQSPTADQLNPPSLGQIGHRQQFLPRPPGVVPPAAMALLGPISTIPRPEEAQETDGSTGDAASQAPGPLQRPRHLPFAGVRPIFPPIPGFPSSPTPQAITGQLFHGHPREPLIQDLRSSHQIHSVVYPRQSHEDVVGLNQSIRQAGDEKVQDDFPRDDKSPSPDVSGSSQDPKD